MRTTVDIADSVYADLKSQAADERTSVKALLDQAARLLLSERRRSKKCPPEGRMPWPTIGSADSPKIGPFSNDRALFGEFEADEH